MRMVLINVAVGIFLFTCGCGEIAEGNPDAGAAGIALLAETPDTISLIFGSPEAKAHVEEILANETTPFGWIKFDVGTKYESALHSKAGLAIDFTKPAPIWFSQVYRSGCHPGSLEPPEPCWLFERYQAGEEGLSGTAHLHLSDTGTAEANLDIYWEGITDRFEGPPSSYGHGTSAGYADKVEQVP